MTAPELWAGLGWPLARLVASVSAGLMVASLIESLNWTHAMARVASPLVRLGHLSDVSGASFSMAFFSGITANTMLAEAYERREISRRELVLSNLFNSLPTYFLHLPSLFFLAVSIIGEAAAVYVGLTLLAAVLRTLVIVVVGRLFLPPLPEGCVTCRLSEGRVRSLKEASRRAWERFKTRIRRILLYTVPVYVAIFLLHRYGWFSAMESYLAQHAGILAWLPPESLSIVILSMAGEASGAYAAAGALLHEGELPRQAVVAALLVGTVLASPMRAFRTQFPYYAGIFKPVLAFRLVLASQLFRVGSVILVGAAYYFL